MSQNHLKELQSLASQEKAQNEKSRFLFKNLFRGLAWFAVLLVLYVLFKDNLEIRPESWVGQVSDRPFLVLLIFFVSEVIVGIIPPEVFMAWAQNQGDIWVYSGYVTIFALISYFAGVIGYFVGRILNQVILYRYARRKFFAKYETFLRRFGGFLIFVAAVTPLPYSGVCMVVGSAKYPFDKFLLISLTRFLRFAFYSFLLWKAGTISF